MPVKSLYEMAQATVLEHIDGLEGVGSLSFNQVKVFLDHVKSPSQLRLIEDNSPQLTEHTGYLWRRFLRADFGCRADRNPDLINNNATCKASLYFRWIEEDKAQVVMSLDKFKRQLDTLNSTRRTSNEVLITRKKALKAPGSGQWWGNNRVSKNAGKTKAQMSLNRSLQKIAQFHNRSTKQPPLPVGRVAAPPPSMVQSLRKSEPVVTTTYPTYSSNPSSHISITPITTRIRPPALPRANAGLLPSSRPLKKTKSGVTLIRDSRPPTANLAFAKSQVSSAQSCNALSPRSRSVASAQISTSSKPDLPKNLPCNTHISKEYHPAVPIPSKPLTPATQVPHVRSPVGCVKSATKLCSALRPMGRRRV